MKILIFYNESIHMGRAHFHVVYADYAASFDMVTCKKLAGTLPCAKERSVCRWAKSNQKALLENWVLAREHETMNPVDPPNRH
jgi:hypothetical protein